MAKPHQNALETAMRVSPFISAKPTLFEGSEPSAPKEDDSEDLSENE
jgi:hypothetical protein